ncbi:MAG: carbon starvation protein A [Deltaproteobacteria bacterium]|nr:carbon starvation protein A [Deltaproteobacteria bacterium]MBW2023615.1 carbon starvation protein A [Deltaproteobacteria bacterium]MBW2083827.1 carbon starvation protein A [Deltaproteobacteria bacterium]RLB82602.1 MAG: carbon starvation protein A [Deltaproteobacteria bacterium]
MGGLLIMVIAFIGYLLAYQIYGRTIGKKIFMLSNANRTPAVELEDGIDYVPTKKEVIFGHHFTSIAGTGPIVGPAIGVIWGWVPAMIWIFFGTIIMGAVHDFGALVISMRNQGKSIAEYTSKYVNSRTKFLFFVIVFLELWIVIAIFGLVIAIVFNIFPQAVLPVWCEIPIAVILGYMVYKKGAGIWTWSIIAVVVMYATVILGYWIPLKMPSVAGIPPTGVWTIILLVYAFIASVLPVTTLLQPRDFINSHQLIVALGLLVLGVLFASFGGHLHVVAPSVQVHPAKAPPMWPFLFVTIACGAISGFHSLVSSGTSSKQVRYEEDALFVGYGSMLMEGVLATLVIVAVAAGIGIGYTKGGETVTGVAAWTAHYSSWAAAKGLGSKITAFVVGSANMIQMLGIPHGIALVIMGVFLASFAGTTLDTATRIQRYVIAELTSDIKLNFLSGRYPATFIAVGSAMWLAFATGASGKGALTLWPMFGAVNQTLAALALIVITVYLKYKGGLKWIVSGLPATFMAIMTIWAVVLNQTSFLHKHNTLLTVVNLAILVVVLWIVVEGVIKFFTISGEPAGEPEVASG